MLVNQVALLIDKALLLVNETVLALLQLGHPRRTPIEVSLNAADVEPGESKNLREFSVLECELVEDESLLRVDDIALAIDQVALFVDSTAHQVDKTALLALLNDYLGVGVFLENSHHLLDVESASLVVEEFMQVAIFVKLGLIKFLATRNVNDMALIQEHHPSLLVAAAAFFVNKETLRTLHQLWLSVLVIEVTHQVVRIKVVPFHAERIWNLTILIQVVLRKHLLEVLVFNDCTCLLIYKIAVSINRVSFIVLCLSFCDNDVTIGVSRQVAQNVIFVKCTEILSGRYINWFISEESLGVVHKSISIFYCFVHARHSGRHLNFALLSLSISILHSVSLLGSGKVLSVLVCLLLHAGRELLFTGRFVILKLFLQIGSILLFFLLELDSFFCLSLSFFFFILCAFSS